MVGTQDPMCVEDVKMVIDQLLHRMPEGERVSLLQSQLARCGIREPSSERGSVSGKRARARTAKRRSSNAKCAASDATGDAGSPLFTSDAEPAPDKESHPCGLCKEMNHELSCVRKNDLKRHFGDFHQIVTEYRCPVENCLFTCELKKQFSKHIKIDGLHRQVVTNHEIGDHRHVVCRPVKFACGFAGCSLLFETPTGGDSATTFGEYVEHVMKHYDEEELPLWSYSTRIQNLLRQSRFQGVWKHFSNVGLNTLEFGWEWTTTLRRDLLTGQFLDPERTLKEAISIGLGHQRNYGMERQHFGHTIATGSGGQGSPLMGISGALPQRRKNIGRRRQPMRKTSVSQRYAYGSSSNVQESIASPGVAMTGSADPSPSPGAYQASVNTTPTTPLMDTMPQVYARGSPEVFMGAEATQVDPRLYPGVTSQNGFVAQRELPSYGLGAFGGLDAETMFTQSGLNNSRF
ncbi:hypothetical protein LLEC1_05507 [Akanthomyces lecanii]|uniref:C2H2-type domain-containing protein n=1 Tax=Cordyceps confragosa TaxID=2714763 RepID=A0A179IQN3_CORDF|nr:hypothetical protein LLEC1_05507 [Akanthomyces lecanii]